MAQKMSMDKLAEYLTEQVKQVQNLEKEVDQIQVGFNGSYATFRAQHDALLANLAERVSAQYDGVSPALRARIEAQGIIEVRQIEERRQALRAKEIPGARAEADKRQAAARAVDAERAKRNPLMDKKEEQAKATLADLKAQLDKLNDEIGKAGRGLGFVTRYGRIVKLDRERNRVIGQIEATRKQLNDLRVEWNEVVKSSEVQETQLQGEWRALSLKAAELQAELDYLDDEPSRIALGRRRAVSVVLDAATDPTLYPEGALHDEIQQMIRLNIQTDNYQRGLGAVAGLIALLRSVAQGFGSILASVEAILKEQNMHSAYLGKLSIQLPDSVLSFDEQWGPLQQKVRDEGRLSKYPLEFLAIAQPALQSDLSRESIERMFTALGNELTRATKGWKG